jgi:hypothetical protein
MELSPVFLGSFALVIIAVGAWYLYELGKERGRKGK